MARPEKVQAVADIKDRIENAKAVFVAEYAGLSVKSQQQLRRALRAGGGEFKIVKMSLARRAIGELSIEGFDEMLLGPTGLVYADTDAVSAAKALHDFAQENERLVIKGGILGDLLLAPERISQLAEIEPRDVLLAKIAGAAKAPLANMAGLMAAFTRNTASIVKALIDKKTAEGDTSAAAETAPEAQPEAEATAVSTEAVTEPESTEDTAKGDEASSTEAEAQDATEAATEVEPTEAAADDDAADDDAAEEVAATSDEVSDEPEAPIAVAAEEVAPEEAAAEEAPAKEAAAKKAAAKKAAAKEAAAKKAAAKKAPAKKAPAKEAAAKKAAANEAAREDQPDDTTDEPAAAAEEE